MLIEEPFTGENVARSVRDQALTDIMAELQRALESFSGPDLGCAFQVGKA